MFISKKRLPRRLFLKGLGASVAVPLLDAMMPAAAAMTGSAASGRTRLGFFYLPHGAVMDHTPHGAAMDFWTPVGEGSEFVLKPILAPLEDLKTHMTVVSGLGNEPATGSAVHATAPSTWLTCTRPVEGRMPAGCMSADHVAARTIGASSPFPSLSISAERAVGRGACASAYPGVMPGISLGAGSQPMETDPRSLLERLFTEKGHANAPPASFGTGYANAQPTSIVDLAAAPASALRRRLGPQDRTVLDEYLASIRGVEQRIERLEQQKQCLDVVSARGAVDAAAFDQQLHLLLDIVALAFQADLTRVVSFMMAAEGTNRTYSNIGVNDAFHPLSHHGNDPEKMRRLARIQRYHAEAFGTLLRRLSELPDGDGSILDNSMLLYGSNMSSSELHDHSPLPIAVFGRGAGRIKGHRHLRYPDKTPLANLHLTLLQRSGIAIESFGDSSDVLAEI